MNSILISLLIVAALTFSVVVAQETLRVSTENAQRVDSALHGKTTCVKLDGNIYCASATPRTPFKLASN